MQHNPSFSDRSDVSDGELNPQRQSKKLIDRGKPGRSAGLPLIEELVEPECSEWREALCTKLSFSFDDTQSCSERSYVGRILQQSNREICETLELRVLSLSQQEFLQQIANQLMRLADQTRELELELAQLKLDQCKLRSLAERLMGVIEYIE